MNRSALRLLDALYTTRCGCCGERIAYDRLVCDACSAELAAHPADYAAWCAQRGTCEVPWDGAAAAFRYVHGSAATAGVLAVKDGLYGFAQYAGRVLADRVREIVDPAEISCVTWVPVTKRRRRQQGYAHTELLGKSVAEALRCKARGDLLTEHAGALRQHQIPEKEREAYAARFRHTGADLTGQTVLLCDDVLTTGSTLRQCTNLLKACGASRVFIAAATVRHKEESLRDAL